MLSNIFSDLIYIIYIFWTIYYFTPIVKKLHLFSCIYVKIYDCIKDLKRSQICDGIIDCHDLSDEQSCPYCSKTKIHCGFGKKCISKNARCDGKIDCPNASDERLCLILEKNFSQMILKPERNLMPYSLQYNLNGIVVFNEKGHFGKLCADNLINKDIKPIAFSLCQSLTFKSYSRAEIEKNLEPILTQYVQVSNITKTEIEFERTSCEGKNTLYVKCENFSCGLLPIKFQSKKNSEIYWPWHVTLYKDNVHICDATLITSNWILTTISCFQGQQKAEWIANFGTNRLHSSPPWISDRRIVGMVKSPIEGSSIVLLKLEESVILSDFIRPICLSKSVDILQNSTNCYTLGWSRKMQQLQTIPITFRNMEICENISVKNTNSLCAENERNINDCDIEEFTGTSLICLSKNNLNWNLIGISNWRIACSSLVTERPRLYDKVFSNIEWIEKTVNNL